jgi:hypothetical protein
VGDATDELDELAPRHVLEALTVPDLPYDFADRVMGSLQAAPAVMPPPRRNALPWVIAACASAFAIAAAVMVFWSMPRTAEPPIVIAAPEAPAGIAVATPVAASPAAPQLGHLVLTVEPRDAIVRVDGQSIAGPSPFVATNLAVGRHAIAVEREGFEAWSRTIDVPTGELDLPIVLVAVAPAIEPTKPTATVRMRGRESSAPIGLKDPFHKGGESSDPLAGGEGSPDLMDPFMPASAKTATLRIGTTSGDAPARVSVDGKFLGMTPISAHKVAPGRHRVSWRWADGREVIRTVTVADGEIKIVKNG